MTRLADPPDWTGPSDDPNDEQFGDVVEGVALDEAGDYDAVLVGEPYDGAVIGRRGARDGPAAIREALAGLTTHHVTGGPVTVSDGADGAIAIGDCGDVVVQAGDVAIPDGEAPDAGVDHEGLEPDADSTTGDRADGEPDDRGGEDAIPRADVASVQSAVRQVTDRVHECEALPIFLGGDNSLTYPNAAPLLEDGSLGAISLDAHLDCRAVGDEPTSGTPYRQLHEDGLDAFAVLGARDFETSTAYHDFVAERGGVVRPASRVEHDLDAAASVALDATADADAVHLTVDLDVVDAAAAPGVSAPTPGGLSARTLCSLVETLVAAPPVCSVEVVELAPRLDEGGRTADLAAHVVAHALAGLARRRSAGGALRSDGGRPRRRRVWDGADRLAASSGLEGWR